MATAPAAAGAPSASPTLPLSPRTAILPGHAFGAALDADADAATGWLCRPLAGGADGFVAHVATPNFALEAGEALTPFTPANEPLVFETRFDPQNGARVEFGLEAAGLAAQLTVLDPTGATCVEFAVGDERNEGFAPPHVTVDGEYTLRLVAIRPDGGRARLRLVWRGVGPTGQVFHRETVPQRLTSLTGDARAAAEAALELRAGLASIEELGCTACHGGEAPGLVRRQAPDLHHAGTRLGADWMRRWIAAPHALKEAPAMPSLLPEGPVGDELARDLVAFLRASAPPAVPSEPASEASVLDRGRELFHTVGCVACHGPLEAPAWMDDADDGEWIDEDDDAWEGEDASASRTTEPPPHPYAELAGKWHLEGLRELLADPHAVYPDGRMPKILETQEEVDAVANYLARHFGVPAAPEPIEAARVERGELAFATLGCVNCHSLPGLAPALDAPSLRRAARTGGGCVEAGPRTTAGGAAHYALGAQERARVASALESLGRTRLQPAPLATARRSLRAISCRACHQLEGRGGPEPEIADYFEAEGETDMGDEGRLPPHLEEVGSKLTTPWLREAFAGGRARPYMLTRMPTFGAHRTDGLPESLARLAGVWPDTQARGPEATAERIRAGRELMGPRGVACLACHTFGELPPIGLPGPDVTHFAERLRYDWWRSYVHDPARFKPGTRMPSFSDGRKSAIESVLGGDAVAQADALWAYFTLAGMMPPPEGVGASTGTRLVVEDRPRVFRSFLDDAGSRAIAIGFPSGVHFAYDAAASRLVDAWQGDFIDASGAWSGRGGTITRGQGPDVWRAPAGMPIVPSEEALASDAIGKEAGWRFQGYELERDGSPTLFTRGPRGIELRELLKPLPREGLWFARELRIDLLEGDAPLYLRARFGSFVRIQDASGDARLTALEEGAAEGETLYRIDHAGAPIYITVEVPR